MANYNIGTLDPANAPYSVDNYNVFSADPTDIFKFQLNKISDINIALDPINGDADVGLYRDNGNGYWDSNDVLIRLSNKSGTADDSLNLADQATGTYFARVNYFSGNVVNYNLDVSTTSNYQASNLLPQEQIVGQLGRYQDSITYTDSVGASDTTDTYYFSVESSWRGTITLSGLSNDADIRLISDANNNGIVDSGEVLRSSTNGGTNSESLRIGYSTSTILQVYQYSGNTNYTLTFDVEPYIT